MGACHSSIAPKQRKFTTAMSHTLLRIRKPRAKAGLDFGIGELYQPVKFLGAGAFGEAWLCTSVATGEQVAVKLIPRPLAPQLQTSILREFSIQADLGAGHPNLVQVYEAILTPKYLCLVMECASGGILTGQVASRASRAGADGLFLGEDEARYFFKQFLSAVKYCHAHHVAHRDLKLDNTLLDGSSPPVIKICDFGFAKKWADSKHISRLFTTIGTPVYMSPEVLMKSKDRQGYDGRSVDVWASGILLFVMLMGCFPFDHIEHPNPGSDAALLEVWVQQVSKQWNESPQLAGRLQKLSPECTDLLGRIFVVDAERRITLEQIEQHPWFLKPLPAKYEEQLAKLRQQEAAIQERHLQFKRNEAAIEERDESLAAMVAEATQCAVPGAGTPVLQRIDLREAAVLLPSGGA